MPHRRITHWALCAYLVAASSGCGSGSSDDADPSAVGGSGEGQGGSSTLSSQGGSQSNKGGSDTKHTTAKTSTGGSGASGSGGASGRSSESAAGGSGTTVSLGGKSGSASSSGGGSKTSLSAGGSSQSGGGTTARGGTTAVGGTTNATTALGGTSAKTSTTNAGGTDTGACSDELARGITLQQIAVYQAVKVPVMSDGAEVATAARKARVVSGRDAVFRVFLKTDSSFKARELMARLTLVTPDDSATVHTARKTVNGSSTDADPASTFQIAVPAKALVPSVRYFVDVVECTSPTGTAGAARFPATGDLDLGVKTTGGLKIKVLPISLNGTLPDTSESALAGYAKFMAAIYPITDVTLTVGATITATSLDWEDILDQIMGQRTKDAPAKDVYYYGLLKPTDSFNSFKQTYCNPSCVTGISYLVESANSYYSDDTRCGLGLGYANSTSYKTMAHELGHTHGRGHAPCVTGGTIEDPDPAFPYTGGKLGSWGYDRTSESFVDPTNGTDIMGYCNNQWISDYTYEGIAVRVAELAALKSASVLTSQAPARWLTLWLDARGPHWGRPRPKQTLPSGTAEPAIVYDRAGEAVMSIQVYRTRTSQFDVSMIMVPNPDPSWYSLQVAGAEPIAFEPLGI